MNLNEAAEIVNKSDRAWLKQNLPYIELRAYVNLVETMLSELDPTPITEEWLAENGKKEGYDFVVGGVRFENLKGRWCAGSMLIETLGELRTLLRLCGKSQGETK